MVARLANKTDRLALEPFIAVCASDSSATGLLLAGRSLFSFAPMLNVQPALLVHTYAYQDGFHGIGFKGISA